MNQSQFQKHPFSRFLLISGLVMSFFTLSSTSVFAKPDKDNNPPGAKGGPGTNWENPKGPMGGSGASPDKKPWGFGSGDRDGNPPGMVGGPGTNWENLPGMVGGPGSSPDRQGVNPPGAIGGPGAGPLWKDNPNKVDNPPGAMGGPGTDWGNSAGPMGEPGMSPEARREKWNEWLEKHPEMKEKWEERKEKRQEAMKDWIADRPMPPGQMKDEFDANQDGKLSKDERQDLKASWKEKHDAWKEAHPGAPGKDFDNNPPGMRGGPGTGPDRGGPTLQKAMAKHAGGGGGGKKKR